MSDTLLLTSLWLIPVVGMLIVLAIPKRNESAIRWSALITTIATFAVTLVALGNYINDPEARKSLEVRALSNPLSDITTETATSGETSRRAVRPAGATALDPLLQHRVLPRPRRDQPEPGRPDRADRRAGLPGLVEDREAGQGLLRLFLLLNASMIGVFLSLDLFLFYVFFEVMLLPMYFLIGIWGGPRREYAAIKFLLYTLFGSVFILVAVLILYFWAGDATVPGFNGHIVRHRPADGDRDRRPATTAAMSSSGSSCCSSSASASSCRRSRSTPGSPTPTSRPRRRSA